MSEENQDAGELEEAEIVLDPVFVAHGDSAELREPSEETFDLPAALVAAERATILRTSIPCAIRRNHLNPIVAQQAFV